MSSNEQTLIYSEVYGVLEMLGEEYINAIPKKMYTFIKENRDKSYNPIYDIDIIKKKGYEDIYLIDHSNEGEICDCTHVGEFEKSFNGKCNEYKLDEGCIEYNKTKAASSNNGLNLYVSYYESDYLTLFSR